MAWKSYYYIWISGSCIKCEGTVTIIPPRGVLGDENDFEPEFRRLLCDELTPVDVTKGDKEGEPGASGDNDGERSGVTAAGINEWS